jgi:hypothetical protein
MKLTGIQVFKKLNILLAALLCSILAIALPVDLKAEPTIPADQQQLTNHTEEIPLLFVAGDATPGEAKGILQLDKTLLTPLLYALLLQLYPHPQDTVPSPQTYAATKSDCGLHTILIKGP